MPNERKTWEFKPRWRFHFSAETLTPMRIGDGGEESLRERSRHLKLSDMVAEWEEAHEDPQFASVATALATAPDAGQTLRPCIPGAAIKGALRSWCTARGTDPKRITDLFGPEKIVSQEGDQQAPVETGKLRFNAAAFVSGPSLTSGEQWFDPRRCTAVRPSVAIDPHTGANVAKLLYFTEFVPEGTLFDFSIEADALKTNEAEWFLSVLQQSFGAGEIQLGARESNDWGRLKKPDASRFNISKCDKAEIQAWWKSPTATHPQFAPVTLEARQLAAAPASTLKYKVTLTFTGGFLIGDPSRSRKQKQESDPPPLSRATLRGVEPNTFLFPASSFRGPIRAQARRIWRTLGGELPPSPPQVATFEGVLALNGFYKIFGAPGWRAPIHIGEFKLQGKPVALAQEFVAIDRFTGGAAGAKKFNSEGLWRPVFEGTISINTDLLSRAKVGDWYRLLLAYLWRDLKEGDIYFGTGAARGYGHCTAEIDGPPLGKFDVSLQNELLRTITGKEPAAHA